MSWMVPIALFGWVPIVLGLFVMMLPRRAVIAAFIFAWLFLPWAQYRAPGIITYNKTTATCLSAFLGVVLFDTQRLRAFRLRWVDLPMVIWCLCPFASSVTSGLGPYDGLSTTVYQTIFWGLPYFMGRIYFTNLLGMRDLAIGIFFGGLVYIPLCLYEMKMGPQLHKIVYGYDSSWIVQEWRGGSWRPVVFMGHGLMVGMWMCMASLIGVCLWGLGTIRELFGVPVRWLVVVLLPTALLCKSAGAIVLLALGAITIFAARRLRITLPLMCLIAYIPLHMILRTTGLWSGSQLVELAGSYIGEERAGSLDTRLQQENTITAIAVERPLFGTGTWQTGADQMWLLYFRNHGLVGLCSWSASLLLPATLLLWRASTKQLWSPAVAPAAVLAVVVVLYMVDCLYNSMPIPVYTVVAGGLASLGGASDCSTIVRRIQRPLSARNNLRGAQTQPIGQLGPFT